MAVKTSPLKYEWPAYMTSVSASRFTLREARAEYSRLRTIANRRIATLNRNGYGDIQILKRFPDAFTPLPKDATEREVRKRLQAVAHFVNLKTTTYKGIKAAEKAAIETLNEHGYDYINESNYRAFTEFMDRARSYYGSKKAFDSEEVIEAFEDYMEERPDEVEEAFGEFLEEEWSETILGSETAQKPQKEKTPEQREKERKKKQQKRKTEAERIRKSQRPRKNGKNSKRRGKRK